MLSLLCLLLWGCHRREKTPTAYIDKEMLTYCWFPRGGYWVYQEAHNPGWIDSTYSYGTPHTMIVPDNYGYGFNPEKYDAGIVVRNQQVGQSIVATLYGPNLMYSRSVLKESFDDSTGHHEDDIFFWDDHRPDTLGPNYGAVLAMRLDSIVLQGNTYKDIIVFTAAPLQAAQRTTQVIWAKGIGIVSRMMTDGTVWELVRYRIN